MVVNKQIIIIIKEQLSNVFNAVLLVIVSLAEILFIMVAL